MMIKLKNPFAMRSTVEVLEKESHEQCIKINGLIHELYHARDREQNLHMVYHMDELSKDRMLVDLMSKSIKFHVGREVNFYHCGGDYFGAPVREVRLEAKVYTVRNVVDKNGQWSSERAKRELAHIVADALLEQWRIGSANNDD